MELCNITGLKGKVTIPGDKSISHRCIMFGSIANGTTQIHNFLSGADCLATIRCFRELGIEIEVESDYSSVIVHGKGLHGLSAPEKILDVGNSGTTTRLISGILAGQPFDSKLSGDESLNSRPMKRIIEPLTQMGAHISSILRNGCAPLYITPAQLHGIHYDSPVASAQGEILPAARRSLRRWRDLCHRTESFQKPYRINAERIRCRYPLYF